LLPAQRLLLPSACTGADAMFCQFFASFDVKNKVDAILFYRLLYPTLDERGPRAPSPEKDEHGSSAQLQLQPVDF
jgi:hypothetical protein